MVLGMRLSQVVSLSTKKKPNVSVLESRGGNQVPPTEKEEVKEVGIIQASS